MSELLSIVGSTVLVSAISFVGLLTLPIGKKNSKDWMILLVALSAGVLIGDAFLHLLPESLEMDTGAATLLGGRVETVLGLTIIGFLIFLFIEKVVHWRHCHDTDCEVHTFGYMNLVGDAVHNLMDGLAIAASFIGGPQLGVATTIAIIFHEIPQEVGDFGVLIHSGFTKRRAMLMNFLTALTAVMGGIVGFWLSSAYGNFIGFLLPITAGGFIYISASDLVPELHKEADLGKALPAFAVFILGIVIMWALRVYSL
jgi:zinc and cadmium transporter